MTTYRALAAATPNDSATADNAAYSLGVEFYVTTACWVTEIRFYNPSLNHTGGSGTSVRRGALYSLTAPGATTGTQVVAATNFPAATLGAWNTLTLATPYLLTANTHYMAVVYFPVGRYSSTATYFSGAGAGVNGVTNGPLVLPGNSGPASHATALQMRFAASTNTATVLPTSQSSATNYWIDVTVSDTDPSINAAPTANAGADQSNVEPWSVVTLSGASSSDSDGTVTGYTWTQIAGTAVTLSGSGASRTFTAPGSLAGTSLTFRLTVTDDDAATSAADDVTVSVLAATERAVIGGVEVPMQIREN